MNKLRMAVIGSGHIARVTHIPNYQRMEEVEVAGVCDTRLEAAKSLAEQFQIPAYYDDHKKMLEELKPDAVTICVPNRFHCPITLDALRAGCHVLCEKPPELPGRKQKKWKKKPEGRGNFCLMVFISDTVSTFAF